MADDLLLQALANQQKEYQQNNMWSQGGDVLGAFSQSMMKNPDQENPNDSLIAALVSGLGSGFAKGYGQSQVRSQMADYSQALRGVAKDYYSGGDLGQYYNSNYNSIRDVAPSLEFAQQANKYERQQKISDSLMTKGLAPEFDDRGSILKTVPIDNWGNAEAQNSMPKTLLDSKLGLESDLRKLDYQSQLKQQEMGLVDPREQKKDIVANEDKLRVELQKSGNVASLDTANQLFNSMVQSSTLKTRTGDMDMVLATAKITDPDSVVRTQDSEQVVNTGGLTGYLADKYSYLMGGGTFDDATRQGIMQIAAQRRDELLKTYNNRLKETADVLKLRGGDINAVDVYGHYAPSAEAMNIYQPQRRPGEDPFVPYDRSMFGQPQQARPQMAPTSPNTGTQAPQIQIPSTPIKVPQGMKAQMNQRGEIKIVPK